MPFSRLDRANSIDRGSPGAQRDASGSSFAARFGRIILRDGVAALPSALYHFGGRLNLYAQHVWFISYILSHKWDEDLPYPSLGNMSRCSGMSKRQLQRYRDELQSMGYLRVYARSSSVRGQETNAYDFAPLFERLESCIAEARGDQGGQGGQSTQGAQGEQNAHVVQGGQGAYPNAFERGYAGSIAEALTTHYSRGAGYAESGAQSEWERSERDGSFVARYGRVISRYGIAAVPRALFSLGKELALTPQQAWFAAYIFSHQWDTALPYPSIVKMSANTGYTIANLHNIKSSLVSRGYLNLVHRTKANGTQDSNAYDFSPLLDAMSNILQPRPAQQNMADRQLAHTQAPQIANEPQDDPGVENGGAPSASGDRPKLRRGAAASASRRDRQASALSTLADADSERPAYPAQALVDQAASHPRHTEYSVPGDAQYTVGGDMQYSVPRDTGYTVPRDTGYTVPRDTGYTVPRDAQYTVGVKPTSQTPVTRSTLTPVTRSGHDIEPLIEQDEKNDSSRIAPDLPGGNVRKRHDKGVAARSQASENSGAGSGTTSSRDDRAGAAYSSYIVKVATDFSYELGDGAHVLENAGQAQRLWRASRLDEQAFVQAMYDAKERTRTAQNSHGAAGLLNKMAYFFACLRTLITEMRG